MKVKIFTSITEKGLEDEINEFLETHEVITTDIKLSVTSFAYPRSYEGDQWGLTEFSALVVYKD